MQPPLPSLDLCIQGLTGGAALEALLHQLPGQGSSLLLICSALFSVPDASWFPFFLCHHHVFASSKHLSISGHSLLFHSKGSFALPVQRQELSV